jgi:hypothetical protein
MIPPGSFGRDFNDPGGITYKNIYLYSDLLDPKGYNPPIVPPGGDAIVVKQALCCPDSGRSCHSMPNCQTRGAIRLGRLLFPLCAKASLRLDLVMQE